MVSLPYLSFTTGFRVSLLVLAAMALLAPSVRHVSAQAADRPVREAA